MISFIYGIYERLAFHLKIVESVLDYLLSLIT